jgi:acid stress-induced BolA-like protein IbaG/YrbA
MIHPELVTEMIKAGLPDAQVQTLSPDGEHFEVTVISSAFAGKRMVQQHQLVYGALKDAMASEAIHALALKTYTPEAWATENPAA